MNVRLAHVLAAICWLIPILAVAEDSGTSLSRLQADVEFLASDALEGRGPGTEGLAKAAQFVREQFRQAGLESGSSDGSYFQPFDVSLGEKVVPEETHLILRGPAGQLLELKVDEAFRPLYTGEITATQAPIVFAGYGITAPENIYDDYRDLDIEGKVVLIIRREPQQDRADSVFQGTETSPHAFLANKIKQAAEHKAAAVLLVNDPFTVAKDGKDALMDSQGPGLRNANIPFAQVTLDVANAVLSSSALEVNGKKLASVQEIETQINENLSPLSQPLSGWTADLQFTFKKEMANVANVIGVLKGEGPLADEYVVIGAHYDHLGYGGFGSRRPTENAVHNGADDNASGTAAVLELARRFAGRETRPARTVVFVAFSAEERGLLGSSYFVNNPTVPLEKTIAMINFDMIGNLRNNELGVHGTGSGEGLAALIDATAEDEQLTVNRSDGVIAASDHYSFYQKHIPVAFFFTGLTDIYHTPDDDKEYVG